MNASRCVFAASLVFLGLVSATGRAHGATIVDTGGSANPTSIGWSLHSDQWLAGKITLTDSYTITGIEMWLDSVVSGNLLVAVYSDNAGLPGSSLHEVVYDAPDTPDDTAEWLGPQGLSWDLGPGDFWVVFGADASDATWYAAGFPAPSPLAFYAASVDSEPWYIDNNLELGIRVHGELQQTAVVPEPATLGLLGLGLGGLAVRQLRRRR